MNKNVKELRTILKEYNLNEPAYKGLIDIEVLKGVLDEVDRLNNIIDKSIEYITYWHYRNDFRINSFTNDVKNELLKILKGEEK